MQVGMPPPQNQGMSTLKIVLIVVGVLALLGLGTCAAGVIFAQREAKKFGDEIKDGSAFDLVSPPEVKAALAGPKKDYVGHWRSKAGSTLNIDADGHYLIEKDEDGDGTKEKIEAPIDRFEGNDIVIKFLVTITTKVKDPPHQVGGEYEMTADGIHFTRR